jgi:hypothetical protein
MNLRQDGRTPLMGNQPVARLIPTQDNINKQKRMFRVGFKPMIPVFARAKACRAFARHCDRLNRFLIYFRN